MKMYIFLDFLKEKRFFQFNEPVYSTVESFIERVNLKSLKKKI